MNIIKKGREEGRAEGRMEGKVEGKLEGKIEILYTELNLNLDEIKKKIAGYTEEQVEDAFKSVLQEINS